MTTRREARLISEDFEGWDPTAVRLELPFLIGGQYSIAGGLGKVYEQCEEDGVLVAQSFLGSSRDYFPGKLDDRDIAEARANTGLIRHFIHTPFFINLLASSDHKLKLSCSGVAQHLRMAAIMGLRGVNTHVGSLTGRPSELGPSLLRESLQLIRNKLYSETKGGFSYESFRGEKPWLLLEIAVGSGSQVGDNLDFLDEFVREFHDPEHFPVGLCIDTCHAFGAGYDLKDASVIEDIKRKHGDIIKLIHLNDADSTIVKCGNKKDRHECIGAGAIGLTSMFQFVEAFRDVPMVLERQTREGIRRDLMTLLRMSRGDRVTVADVWSETKYTRSLRKKRG